QVAPAKIGIADEIERGIGGNESAAPERAQQMARAHPDDFIDALARRSCSDWGIGRTLWMLLRERVDKVGDRLCDGAPIRRGGVARDRKSTRLNSSHLVISYAVFCL